MAPARIEAARRLGANEVINAAEEDTVSRMVELTGGHGPDVVFDCAGIKNTLDQALNAVRRAGQVVLVAVPWEPMPLQPVNWMAREVTLDTTFGADPEDWKTALDLIADGKVTMEPLLSKTSFVPLDEIQPAFEALAKPSTQLQMVVKLSADAGQSAQSRPPDTAVSSKEVSRGVR